MSDKKESFKEIHGKTRVGLWLKDKAPNLLKTLLNVGGEFVPGGTALKKIAETIKTSSDLQKEEKTLLLTLLELDVIDRNKARDMQIAALSQNDPFAKRFIYYFAIGISGFSMVIVLLLFFIEIPESNQRIIDMILGVIIGSGLISVINFFFGSSKGSKDKTNLLGK